MKFTIINLFSFGFLSSLLLLVLALATATLLGLDNNSSLWLVSICVRSHSGVDNLASVGGHLSDEALTSQLR